MDDNRRFRNTEILTQDDRYILKKEREEDKQVYFDLYKEDSILAKRMSSDMFQDFLRNNGKIESKKSLYMYLFLEGRILYI